jgi:hypothetical protein
MTSLIIKTDVTDASLLAHSVPETDHPAWVAATSYTVGTRVIRTTTHRIYECVIAGVNATVPELAPTRWINVAPTNRWAAFDRKVGSRTTASGTLSMTIAPGTRVGAVALLDVQAATANVTMVSSGQTVYNRTVTLTDTVNPIVDYYTYWQAEFLSKRTLVLQDLPSVYSSAQITITLTGSAIQLGSLVMGKLFDIGQAQRGMGLDIADYSLKTPDAYGVIDFVQGDYSQRLEAAVVCENDRLAVISRTLTDVRATPVVVIGANNIEPSIIYGLVKGWRLLVSYKDHSIANLTIEGLT